MRTENEIINEINNINTIIREQGKNKELAQKVAILQEELKGVRIAKKQADLNNLKRYTIIERESLKRGKKGYFSNEIETIILKNSTDKKIEIKLLELNKGKRSRFYEVKHDFKLTTKQGKKDFMHYLIDNENTEYKLVIEV